ncbi:hypothetical protein HNR77_004543 [Paenibacillus sp. JGP012]|uniref:hypothetical protein n=1 Tax=Paenibacillus TaxID=44249 RepID=UPI00160D6B52|nr:MULTISPECIES: hypothetical protein [Paenibacillus]MBB6023443.1 hypothetical protein [Paenibacillus sp. JGP012]MBU5353453.1 hypothetical protein [Paenibacillus barcinonensis]MDM5279585.1 hypothetical protein [Paenibacillus silvae]
MKTSGKLKLASLILGPLDYANDFCLYQGYVVNECYFIFLEESSGVLWLRHVCKVEHIDNLYINGDGGGIMLIEQTRGDITEIVQRIVDRLSGMDALTFLTDVLLWTPERVDMSLKLDRFQ